MKSRKSRDDGVNERGESDNKKNWKMKKNMQRLGGAGLSLEAFANAKSRNNAYNPALLKKKREFYKNAKHVSKYKKMIKQQGQPNDPSSSVLNTEVQENESRGSSEMYKKNKKRGKEPYSLNELYEKKREEEDKARMEREAITKAKKEARERAEARRKAFREKMFKKTRKGQPVMKYRIEHLLETIQGSKA